MRILVPDCHLLGRSRLYLGVFVFKIIIIMVPIDNNNNTDLIIQPMGTRGVNTPKAVVTEPGRR